jgi:hypothetical protein
MCVIELEPCEVWILTAPKARKPYTCECCAARIAPGDRYHRTFSVFEGTPTVGRNCAACEADIAAFAEAHDGTRSHPDYFVQMLGDCIDDGDEDSERQWKPMLEAIRARRP